MEHLDTILLVLMAIILFVARFAVDKMVDTPNTKVRFGLILFNMILYTGFMGIYIYLTYENTLHNRNIGMEDFYEEILSGFLTINFALMLVAVLYFFMCKKRKISDLDRMKLKDL